MTVTVNLVLTMGGNYHMVYHSPTIRFTFFGAIAFTVASVIGLLASLRSVDSIVHFTQFQNGQSQLLIYSFFSMVMFGAIYYILPRLVGCEWLSSSMISLHFWGSAYGGGLLALSMLLGGLITGAAFAAPDTEIDFTNVMEMSSFFIIARIAGWLMVGLAHLIFGMHFLLMLLRIGQPVASRRSSHPSGRRKNTNEPFYLSAGGDCRIVCDLDLRAGARSAVSVGWHAAAVCGRRRQDRRYLPDRESRGRGSRPRGLHFRGLRLLPLATSARRAKRQRPPARLGRAPDSGARLHVRFPAASRQLPHRAGSGQCGLGQWRNERADENPQYKPAKRDAAWQLLHLYAPTTIISDSKMPAYRYLFDKRKISGQRSVDALNVPIEEGYEIVPKPEAKSLVGYLLSLDKSHALKEVKTATPEVAAK